MQLYRYLDTLQDKALYCDTDSVVYVQPKDETLSSKLGIVWGL